MNIRSLAALIVIGLLTAAACLSNGCRREEGGQIMVDSRPEGADLSCNGVPQERTPTTLTGLPPGTHLLVASLPGHREARISVTLMEGQRVAVTMELEPIEGLVLVHSEPEGAEVLLNGAFRGRTPLLMPNVPLGSHRLQIDSAGYLPRELELRVGDRIPRKVSVDLVSDAAELRLATEPAGAEVRINGVSRGTTPRSVADIQAGEVTLELLLDGYARYERSLSLRAGDSREINVELTPLPGSLRIVSLPGEARVYVDDRFSGDTPLMLNELSPGEYRVRVEKDGYAPLARNVRVAASSPEVEEFRLERTSGTLVLVTEPAGVQVYISGELMGTTEPSRTEAVSEPFEIDTLSAGEHVLQLSREGYRHLPRRIRIAPDEIVNLHEQLERRFIPDTRVLMPDGRERRGVLLNEYSDGSIELEIRPGVVVRIEADQVLRRESL